jgi:hypothetical protein
MEEKLDRMFMNITATGAHAWAPLCGKLPSPKVDICKDDVIPLEDSDDSVDSMPIQTPGSKECVSGRGEKEIDSRS